MNSDQNTAPTLDKVLTDMAAAPKPPDARQMRGWVGKYPQYKSEIIDFATAWVEMEALCVEHVASTDEVDLVVNRTMSRAQKILDDSLRIGAVTDLITELRSAGHDIESFELALGVDRSILTCLAARLIVPATVPKRLVESMATALGRSADVIRDYFHLSPKPAAAFKARQQPATQQVPFADLVKSSHLSDSGKRTWLAEAPDPDLRRLG